MQLTFPRSLSCALATLALCHAAAAHATLVPGAVNSRSMIFEERTRLYDVWVPSSYDGSTPVPLVLDIHGLGSNKTQQRQISGMAAQADLHGFLVAYPQGYFGAADNPEGSNLPAGPSWNAGDFCCGDAVKQKVDDLGFLEAVAADLEREANIDVRRVYATGLSNGGAMSQFLACRGAETFAATAPMAFPIDIKPLSACQPSRPISVRHYAGLTDTLVPYNGTPGGLIPSAAASFQHWHDVTSCAGDTPDETIVHGTSRCETYTSCAAGTRISLCSINASPVGPFPGHVLYFNPDLDLAADAWSFLSSFQAPAPTCGDGSIGAGEECDDGNVTPGDGCDASCRTESCGAAPEAGCRGTQYLASRLRLRRGATAADNQMQWKWSRGRATTLAEFGDPTVDEDLHVCVYSGGALVSATRIAAGGTCDGGAPCWKTGKSGYAYANASGGDNGVTQMSVRAGEGGKAGVQVKARGANLAMPGALAGPVVVQLRKTRHGFCWQSEFDEPFAQNNAKGFAASGD